MPKTPSARTTAFRPAAPRAALEVRVEWGEGDALRVEHFAEPRAFHVGDSRATRARVDFDLEQGVLGVERFTLVEPAREPDRLVVRAPLGASIELESNGVLFDAQALRAAARVLDGDAPGTSIEIRQGERATVTLGAFRFIAALVEPESPSRPRLRASALLVPVAALAFALACVHAHREFLGRQVRYVDARIDLSHPAMAALLARRAERARHAPQSAPAPNGVTTPTAPRAPVPRAEPTTPPPALPQGTLSSAASTSTRAEGSRAPTDAPSRVDARAAGATEPAPAITASADAPEPPPAPEPSDEERANARRVAMMFSMRQASRGLADCYARFPTNGPDAATQASHLSRCIAEVRESSRAIARSEIATNDTPGRDAALIEWDIEVDTHAGETVSYEGGRAFVATSP